MSREKHTQGLVVRRLYAADQSEVCEHFLRLDNKSRRSRFCGTVNDDAVRNYACNIFKHQSIICGASVNGTLRGLVELTGVLHAWRPNAEAAFSVEAGWQNKGIGDALFDRIFAIAQNRNVRVIHMMCLKENSRMKHLATKHHARLSQNQDAVEAILYPYWPTPASVAKEVIGEANGFVHSVFGSGEKVPPVQSSSGLRQLWTPTKAIPR